ncbi:hypothetical protein [Shewanella sp.]|uniref:hypothetical protein n=1 Tax=Shewanella sp. TaxID=50422 RepID=UPI004048969F
MRLDRFVSKSTELTPQQVSDCIAQATVWVNGVAITDEASQVHENNLVQLNGQTLGPVDLSRLFLQRIVGHYSYTSARQRL